LNYHPVNGVVAGFLRKIKNRFIVAELFGSRVCEYPFIGAIVRKCLTAKPESGCVEGRTKRRQLLKEFFMGTIIKTFEVPKNWKGMMDTL
jgi:hypothetical protein